MTPLDKLGEILAYVLAAIAIVCITVLIVTHNPVPAELWVIAGLFGGGGLGITQSPATANLLRDVRSWLTTNPQVAATTQPPPAAVPAPPGPVQAAAEVPNVPGAIFGGAPPRAAP